MRFAVRPPNWLGDAVMSLPALADLESTFPDAGIDYFVTPAAAEVCERARLRGRAVRLDTRGRARLLAGALGALRRTSYDAGLVLPPSFSSALLFRAGGVPECVGFSSDARDWLLAHAERRVPRGQRHLRDEYRDLVRALARRRGAESANADEPMLVPRPEDRDRIAVRLGAVPRPWIVLAPGAVYGPTKRWPASRFAALADVLHTRHGGTTLVVGAGGDAVVAAEVERAAETTLVNLAGASTLGELIALLADADVVVSNDSGAMHVAGAVNAPLVAIFGSTNPEWTSPAGRRVTIVRRDEPCAPCYRPDCAIGIVCLTRIDVGEIADAASRALGAAS